MNNARIPVVDITTFRDGTDRSLVARRVADACRDTGFFVITGHGIERDLIRAVREAALRFFRQSPAEKARYHGHGSVGYSPFEEERLANSLGEETPPDLKEAFTVAQVDVTEDEYYTDEAAAFFYPNNVWPEFPGDLRELSEAYYRSMGDLSTTLCEIFAVALELPQDYFAPMIDKPFSFLRYVYYPALSAAPGVGQLRAGAHSDYGSFTFVNFNDAPGGLQVHGGDGEWIDVPVVPDSFVVNLGDLMEQWTNDQWRSTLHRVVVPEEDELAASERLSLVFFHEPNYDTMIEALPTCIPAGEVARYEPVSCGEHLARKVMAQQDLGDG